MLPASPVPTVDRGRECGVIRRSCAPISPLTGIIPVGRSSLLAECHLVATGHITGATRHLNEATLININTSSDVGRSRQVATYGALWRMRLNCDYSMATLTGNPILVTMIQSLFLELHTTDAHESNSSPGSAVFNVLKNIQAHAHIGERAACETNIRQAHLQEVT